MSPPSRSLLNHIVCLHDSFKDLPLSINIDGRTFTVTLKGNRCEFYLYPKFLQSNPNQTCYIKQLNSDVTAFSGWQNYRRAPFSESCLKTLSDKIKTKLELQRLGVKVPTWSNKKDNDISPCIVKKQISSFAADIHGPFNKSSDCNDFFGLSEFFEEFIEGNIVKIWFWKGSPIILESQPMPTITGNGAQTVEELIRIQGGFNKDFLYEDRIDEMLDYYKKTRDEILERDEELLVDFRYGSMLADPELIDDFYTPLKEYPQLQEQIDILANAMKIILCVEEDADYVFTVDAILSDDTQLYVLEVNTNPEIHPYLYQYMARSIQSKISDA